MGWHSFPLSFTEAYSLCPVLKPVSGLLFRIDSPLHLNPLSTSFCLYTYTYIHIYFLFYFSGQEN